MGSAAINTLDLAAAAKPAVTASGGIPNINSLTGLSTDYLNHFTEAVMLLEMVTAMPECLDDLLAWQPKTYCEHFADSLFSHRAEVIAAYRTANPDVRDALDRASETLNTVLAETRDVVVQHLNTPEAEVLAQRAVAWLKPLIARMAAVINGTASGFAERLDPQTAIDAMFER